MAHDLTRHKETTVIMFSDMHSSISVFASSKPRCFSLIVFVLLLSNSSLATAQIYPPYEKIDPQKLRVSYKNRRLSVYANKCDFREVIEVVGRKVGMNILAVPGLDGRITVDFRDCKLLDAMHIFTTDLRCDFELAAQNVILFTRRSSVHFQYKYQSIRKILHSCMASYNENLVIAPAVNGKLEVDYVAASTYEFVKAVLAKTGVGLALRQDGAISIRAANNKAQLRNLRRIPFYPDYLNRNHPWVDFAESHPEPGRIPATEAIRIDPTIKKYNILDDKSRHAFETAWTEYRQGRKRYFKQLQESSKANRTAASTIPHRLIEVNAKDLPLRTVIASISKKIGTTITVDKSVQESQVTMQIRDISSYEAVSRLASEHHAEIVKTKNGFCLIPLFKISMSHLSFSVEDLFKGLSLHSQREIKYPSEMTGRVTVYFHECPLKTAVSAVAQAFGDYKVIDHYPKGLEVIANSSPKAPETHFDDFNREQSKILWAFNRLQKRIAKNSVDIELARDSLLEEIRKIKSIYLGPMQAILLRSLKATKFGPHIKLKNHISFVVLKQYSQCLQRAVLQRSLYGDETAVNRGLQKLQKIQQKLEDLNPRSEFYLNSFKATKADCMRTLKLVRTLTDVDWTVQGIVLVRDQFYQAPTMQMHNSVFREGDKLKNLRGELIKSISIAAIERDHVILKVGLAEIRLPIGLTSKIAHK